MRRWNGWGDDATSVPLPETARKFLEGHLGPSSPPRDATLAEVLARVPASRIRAGALVDDPETRARRALGQSYHDWVGLRSGRFPAFPDAVAFPSSGEEVRALFALARQTGAKLIPYGGGTSVAGHVNPDPSGPPSLTVDLSRLSQLLRWDATSRLATFGAGVAGPALEAALAPLGVTLGHFPQSFELSTLGGWIAARSSGQQSLAYGRIERLFAGGTVESPAGTLSLPCFPASAAGPDLRELILGSEGRNGIVTEATVRTSPLPERDEFRAVFFPSWEHGVAAVREAAQLRLALSMLRLSTPEETESSLTLAGSSFAVSALTTYLRWRGARDAKCLLVAGLTGPASRVRAARAELLALVRRHGGIPAGRSIGEHWRKGRFRGPYLRNTLWEAGYAVDTLETATSWDRLETVRAAVERALRGALEPLGERAHVFTHLSHVYPDGSSLYTTYLFRASSDPDENLHRWRLLKGAASEAIVATGGTITHQHGVGVDHAPYLPREKGELGMSTLRAVGRHLDPDGLLNPGKLYP